LEKGFVMRPFSFIGLFCEDIREEKTNLRTLVGVLPDNVQVGNLPGFLPKLCVYFHIHLDLDSDVKQIKARIRFPDGATIEVSDFEKLIEPVKAESKATGMPFAGLISTATVMPVPITQIGKINAIIEVDGTEYVCGALNLVPVETTAPTASEPPSGQSPPASPG
jgi:hypothetical protein